MERLATEDLGKIAYYLADSGYRSVREWALDSDYVEIYGDWYQVDNQDDVVDICQCLLIAIQESDD